VTEALEGVQGQAETSLAVGAAAVANSALALEGEESLDLVDHFPTGTAGVEDLVEKAPESATDREDAVAAVGALVGLGQQAGGEVLAEELFEVVEAVLAHGAEAAAAGGEAGAPGWEVRCRHKAVYIPSY
jgi:hypothetical protein